LLPSLEDFEKPLGRHRNKLGPLLLFAVRISHEVAERIIHLKRDFLICIASRLSSMKAQPLHARRSPPSLRGEAKVAPRPLHREVDNPCISTRATRTFGGSFSYLDQADAGDPAWRGLQRALGTRPTIEKGRSHDDHGF